MKRMAFVSVVLAVTVGVSGLTIRRVFLDDSIVATGYVQPTEIARLNFSESGSVAEMEVEVGDVVRAGDTLASQDTTALEAQLAAHEAALDADRVALQFQQNPVRPQDVQALQLAVVAATQRVNAAQVKADQTVRMDDALVAAAAGNVQAARDTLASDQQQAERSSPACGEAMQASSSTTTSSTSTTTSTTEPGATTTVPIEEPPSTTTPPDPALINSCGQLAHQIAQDQANLAQAIGAYDQAVSRRQLDAQTLSADVAAAESQLDVARNQLAVGTLPATPEALAAAQAAVAQDTVAIEADRAAIDAAVLVAPADGVVAGIGGRVGEIAGPEGVRVFGTPQALPQQGDSGIQLFPEAPQQESTTQASQFDPLITLNSLTVEVVAQLGEGDLNSIGARQEATVTLPAVPGESFPASVERVEPQAVNIDGRVYFLVELSLPTQPPTMFRLASGKERDRGGTPVVGLTANVSFDT